MAIQLLLALPLILSCPSLSSASDSLTKDSSLLVENKNDLLISPSGTFIAGFFPVGDNAYCFATCFDESFCNNNCTIVWMAYRDQPVNGKRSALSLLKSGNLILTDAGLVTVWAMDTVSESSVHLHLQDSGNLVLNNSEGDVLWQSFDFPTNALLLLQPLRKDKLLVSSRSQTNYSSGFHKLCSTMIMFFIFFLLVQISQAFTGQILNSCRLCSQLERRLTIDSDGNLRLYSREDKRDVWTVSWLAISQPCSIHGIGGPNSICNYVPSFGRNCSCLQGFKMKNVTDWSLGCEPEIKLCSTNEINFLRLTHVQFYGFSKHGNPNSTPYCFVKFRLLNGHRSPSFEGDFYLKVPKTSPLYSAVCTGGRIKVTLRGEITKLDRVYIKIPENGTLKFLLWFASIIEAIEFTDVAKGLSDLHEERLEWVLHCDIKPQNILLDLGYQPKVSDFGLSHPLKTDSHGISRLSRIRGTRGYIAPQWVLNLPITSKVMAMEWSCWRW
ncbi:hypothetical protein GH714_015267 [Hevea brasiliensis]|uniref:Bulb-type lectin domain-containing protein n=1 Tax=Hevea brasiliensis TaxID=3981 RepID=A0A6A6KTH8_HEVBR|nr:hypothetical protein GH714_015267 [Hevea brasiliensis]